MAKKQVQETEDLQSQIAALQAKINEMENRKPEMPNSSLTDELAKLQKHVVKSSNNVPYKIIDDHQNVTLYTGSNHRVGPLHPNNARDTMLRWAKEGVQLYTTKRTEEQVAAFKETKAWKDYIKKNEETRKKYRRDNTAETLENFAKIIARETGKTVQETNAVLVK